MSTFKHRTRRWGPFRQEWYSVCSAHPNYKETCNTCQAGSWENVVKLAIGGWVYDRNPDLWRWWANRPSARRRFMKTFGKHFPNLR